MDLELSEKRVLITGASIGIGAAIAEKFLKEGAKVIIVSRGSEMLFENEKKFQNEFGKDNIFAESCDCTSSESLLRLEKIIQDKWKGIDIVIANVGDGRSVPDPIPNDEQWTKTWNNNFESSLLTARTFLPMLQKSKGCLLFISSITAMEAFGAPVDYSTAKSAVAALAKNMARKLAKEVRVNVLAPGNIYFPGGSWDKKIKQDPVRVNTIIESSVPMNRFGTPEEIADAALFLCSRRAAFITGSVLVVDGGQTVGVF
ncbi:MAG: SDR family oxidoreductase [Gammaproteobacteria bacterium]|nr:SDR family oxidoreductase [Gammaproteobacteria bacterium]